MVSPVAQSPPAGSVPHFIVTMKTGSLYSVEVTPSHLRLPGVLLSAEIDVLDLSPLRHHAQQVALCQVVPEAPDVHPGTVFVLVVPRCLSR